jgi:hypothetical protein
LIRWRLSKIAINLQFLHKEIVAWSPFLRQPAYSNVLPVPLQSFPIFPSLFAPTDLREHSTT